MDLNFAKPVYFNYSPNKIIAVNIGDVNFGVLVLIKNGLLFNILTALFYASRLQY